MGIFLEDILHAKHRSSTGDTVMNIENAVKKMEQGKGIKIDNEGAVLYSDVYTGMTHG